MGEIPAHLRRQAEARAAAGEAAGSSTGDQPTAPGSDSTGSAASPSTSVTFDNLKFTFTAKDAAEGAPLRLKINVTADKSDGVENIDVAVDLTMQNANSTISDLIVALTGFVQAAAKRANQPKDPLEQALGRLAARRAAGDPRRLRRSLFGSDFDELFGDGGLFGQGGRFFGGR